VPSLVRTRADLPTDERSFLTLACHPTQD